MQSYYTILCLITVICLSPLQAAQYIEINLECIDFDLLNASYAKCTTATGNAKDAQIIVPVVDGQCINIQLDTKDPFSLQSVRDCIKKTRLNDDFFILASYRHKLPKGNVSDLKHIDASHLTWQMKHNVDPITGQPIISLDFHEFSYINKNLAIRHLGNNKTLADSNTLLNISIENSLVDLSLNDKLLYLSHAHIVNHDSKRAKKYIRKISADFLQKKYPAVLNQTILALENNEPKPAIELLKKISYVAPDPTLLLYKMYQEEPCVFSMEYIARTIREVFYKQPHAMIELGNMYLCEAAKDWSSKHAEDFLVLAHLHHRSAVKENENIDTIFHLMRDLTFMLNEKSHIQFNKESDLNRYANICIDAINQNNSRLQEIKRHIPLDYEKTLYIIKKYGTKEIIV